MNFNQEVKLAAEVFIIRLHQMPQIFHLWSSNASPVLKEILVLLLSLC